MLNTVRIPDHISFRSILICTAIHAWVSQLASPLSLYYVLFYLLFLGVFAKLRRATICFVMSDHLSVRVSMERPGSHWTDFHEIWYLRIFRKAVKKIQVSLKSVKNNWYFTWRAIRIFLSHLFHFFIGWEAFQKVCRENQNTQFLISNIFEDRDVYEKMWKNTVERGRPQMKIWRMPSARWKPKATNANTPVV